MGNILEPDDIQFKGAVFFGFTDHHYSVCRDDELGIQMESYTRVDKCGGFTRTKPKRYFYIDGCAREFTDLDELCEAWNELKAFDDPNNEIQWVKVIKSKTTS